MLNFDAPGDHGAGVTGIHGIGVSTPNAAAVAEATDGLAKLVHIPNGAIFAMGILSVITAAGFLQALTNLIGKTVRLDGL